MEMLVSLFGAMYHICLYLIQPFLIMIADHDLGTSMAIRV